MIDRIMNGAKVKVMNGRYTVIENGQAVGHISKGTFRQIGRFLKRDGDEWAWRSDDWRTLNKEDLKAWCIEKGIDDQVDFRLTLEKMREQIEGLL